MQQIILHMLNEDPVVCEVEELPQKNDTILLVHNPRRRDGKDLSYLEANVNTVIWPMSRVSFIEVMPGSEDEKIVSFVRE
ncbi:MAG: hypothetical protein Q8R87_03330 [Anaerolineaceae bacterium]|jgi:hypothetical protein|nr:hypothetical protein [Anaerolineae bacterium]MDP3449589.1 hypothetical protein [Anaerolineaceae bacterium]PKO03570.1 MAG: hypothetical protein CVU43_02260 [Chloroflexi bacterium HGW-Chloroflexi-5]